MTGRSLGPPLHLVSPREPWERTLGETPRSARRLFAEPERAGSQGSSAALFSPPSARIGREALGAGVAPSAASPAGPAGSWVGGARLALWGQGKEAEGGSGPGPWTEPGPSLDLKDSRHIAAFPRAAPRRSAQPALRARRQ